MLSENHIQVGQEALFLIDNTPKVPRHSQGVSLRTTTDAAIKHHLASHTYTDQDRKQVTVEWMRGFLKRLCKRSIPGKLSLEPGEDSIDALFRLQSGIILDDVKANYRYNRDSFIESSLPGYEDLAARYIQRRAEGEEHRSQTQRSMRPSGPQVPVPDKPSSGSKDLHEATPDNKTKVPASNPPCQRCHRRKIGCDRQRPCAGCKTAKLGEEECVSVEKKAGRRVGSSPAVSTTKKTLGPTVHPTSRPNTIGFDVATSQVQADQGPWETEDHSGQVDSLAVLGKRKRALKKSDTAAGLSGEDTIDVSERSRRSKRPASGEARPRDEAPTPSPLTPRIARPDLLSSTPMESTGSDAPNVPPQPENPNGFQKTFTPGSADNASNDIAEGQQKTWQLDSPTRETLKRQLRSLQRNLEHAVFHVLLKCIGRLDNAPCPLVMRPSEALAALYERCLGVDWENVFEAADSFIGFRVPQITYSLISAFLYNNILSQQLSVQKVTQRITKLLEEQGELGEFLLQGLAPRLRGTFYSNKSSSAGY